MQVSNQIDDQILRISDTFLQISISPALTGALMFLNEDETESSQETQRKLDRIKNLSVLSRDIQSNVMSNKYIDNMTIIFNDGVLAGSSLSYPEGMDDFRTSSTYKSLLGQKDLYWLSPDQADLSTNKEGLMAGQTLWQNAAVIFIELNYNTLKDILAMIDIGENDVSYLISPTGSIISPYDATQSARLKDWELFRLIREKAETEESGNFNLLVDDETKKCVL